MLNRFLVAGFPKSGKTGTLASVLDAGYTLRYLNFDGNVHPILSFAKPESLPRLQVVDCFDKFKFNPANNKLEYDGAPSATVTAMQALNKWPLDDSRALDWGPKDILVADSGSVMAESALRRNMALNNRSGARPQFGDYQAGHDFVNNLLLHSKRLQCHFIMITHLFLMGPDLSAPDFDNDALAERVVERKLEGAENVPWKLAPKTVGRALHDMAKHFSGVIYVTARGPARRMLLRPADGFDAGVPIPGLPPELDIRDGLARIFEASQ